MEPLLLPPIPDLHTIDVYEAHGGYAHAPRAPSARPPKPSPMRSNGPTSAAAAVRVFRPG